MPSLAAARLQSDSLRTPLFLAVILHAGIFATMLVNSFLGGHENSWGGPGGSVTVGMVGSLPAIPLPTPDVVTPNRVVDNSKGLYQSEPKAPTMPPPDAVPLPKFDKNKPIKPPPRVKESNLTPVQPPKYDSRPSKLLENPAPPPPNAVPYGGGGAPTIPRSSFTMGATAATQGGLSFNGVGGGDFGSRFSYYVTAVQQRVSSNWLQSTIDPSVAWAPRVVVTFDILRNGTVTNIQITQSSNNASVDASARRAVDQSSPLLPLPAAYSGPRVGVEFYFDFRRQ